MKQLISIPLTGYLFSKISRTAPSKNWLDHCGRYYSAVKAVQINQNIFNKPVLDSNKQKNVHLGRNYSSDSQDHVVLMDFVVWTSPGFFQSLRDLYYFFFGVEGLGTITSKEFGRCSGKALQVVSTLLSELRFSELEGLVTPECKEQITRNLQNWTKSEAAFLAVEAKDILTNTPCELVVYSDENDKEKRFAEIRVIHFCTLPFSQKYAMTGVHDVRDEMLRTIRPHSINGKLIMTAVYNCKYIKEITSGINDQWTINKINVRCFI